MVRTERAHHVDSHPKLPVAQWPIAQRSGEPRGEVGQPRLLASRVNSRVCSPDIAEDANHKDHICAPTCRLTLTRQSSASHGTRRAGGHRLFRRATSSRMVRLLTVPFIASALMAASPAMAAASTSVAASPATAAASTACHEDAGWHYDISKRYADRIWAVASDAPTNQTPETNTAHLSITASGTVTIGVTGTASADAGIIFASVKAEVSASVQMSATLSYTTGVDVTLPPHSTRYVYYGWYRLVDYGEYYYLQPSCVHTSSRWITTEVPTTRDSHGWMIFTKPQTHDGPAV